MKLSKFASALLVSLFLSFSAFAQFDPCASEGTAKQNVKIAITTATTTALVAPSGSTTIYVCGFSITISQVVTTANTIKFVQGTGAACASGTADLTGAYGSGGITAGLPIVVSYSGRGTLFKTSAAGGLCATTTIGATAFFHGVVTYVQQ